MLDDPALLVVVPGPDCTDTEGPFGPIVVEPLSAPGLVWIVVEFDVPEPRVDEDLPFVGSFCVTRQGLWLSTTIVVPPLSPAISVLAIKGRMMSLLAIDLAR